MSLEFNLILSLEKQLSVCDYTRIKHLNGLQWMCVSAWMANPGDLPLTQWSGVSGTEVALKCDSGFKCKGRLCLWFMGHAPNRVSGLPLGSGYWLVWRLVNQWAFRDGRMLPCWFWERCQNMIQDLTPRNSSSHWEEETHIDKFLIVTTR